jgi:hypothetical protein
MMNAIEVVTGFSRLENQRMLPFLWQFHTAECSDRRDWIFALYGLLPASEKNLVQNDYNSAWVDIFREQALTNAMAGHSNELLAHLFAFGPLSNSSSYIRSTGRGTQSCFCAFERFTAYDWTYVSGKIY